MKRFIDIVLSTTLIIFLFVPMVLIYILIILSSSFPAIYWSKRVGKNNKLFMMPKFRTMKKNTPEVPTHQLQRHQEWCTPIGLMLRKTSLDELPQLWSVLIGNMSFIGPRPALYSQFELIKKRTELNIHKLRPGITGWAQVNGRDNLSDLEKLSFEQYYRKNISFRLDIKIFFLTIYKVLKIEGVR